MNYGLKVSPDGHETPARMISSENWWYSLEEAEHAFNPGYVATAPDIALFRAHGTFDNGTWNDWITPLGEELKLVRRDGKTVLVNIHGRGLITSPHITGRQPELGFFKITDAEKERILKGELPDGKRIACYSLYDIMKFKRIPDWGKGTFAIFSELEPREKQGKPYKAGELIGCPRYIARIGDASLAYRLARKLETRYGQKEAIEITRYGDYLEDDTGGLLSFGPAFKETNLVGLFPARPSFLAVSQPSVALEERVA